MSDSGDWGEGWERREDEGEVDDCEGFNVRDRFLSDMMKMYREGSFNDVCIKLHDGEIKANKSVLAARSEYFAATFRWKNNNNHDVEEIVVNDCSKMIMTCIIIDYIFSGFLKAKDLNLLEFLELKDQVQKIFPGEKLEEEMKRYLYNVNRRDFQSSVTTCCRDFSFPTNEEIVKALSLVESGNLQSHVLAEFGKFTEKGSDDRENCSISKPCLP